MYFEGRSHWLLCNQSGFLRSLVVTTWAVWAAGAVGWRGELLSWRRKVGSRHVSHVWQCNALNCSEWRFKSLEKRNWNKKQVCLQRSPAWMLGNFKKQSVSKHFTDKRPHHRWRQLVSVFSLYIVKHCLHVWIKMKRGESCPGQARWMWRLGTRGVNIQLSSSRAASHGTCGLLPADLSCCYIHI